MPHRHHLTLVACAFFVVACSNQPPAQAQTQAASLDAPQAPQDTALQRADKARIQGSENAKVWFVIASDFQCPYCKAFHDNAYMQILKDYVATGKVRVAYLNHPMSMHPHAAVAAEAAMCAAMQDRFWQMHDGLFATQERWASLDIPMPVFDSLATSLRLRMPDWRSCMTSRKARSIVDADLARTRASGVKGTPTFFIANKQVPFGAEPYPVFRAALDAALAQAGPPSGGGQRP